MHSNKFLSLVVLTAFVITPLIHAPLASAGNNRLHADKKKVIEHWTSERMAAAIPRDLVIDERGLGYLRKPDGTFEPYGHSTAYGRSKADQLSQAPQGKPSGGNSDSAPPDISNMDPAEGAIIGSSHTFSATVIDGSGVKSVTFVVTYPDGVTTQSFSASHAGNNLYQASLQGFSDGDWRWHVVAKDGATRGGNSGSSDSVNFTVAAGGGSGGGGNGDSHIIINSEWTGGGAVQTAAGRIYFEMPSNPKWKRWSGYVCSGTVATDDTTGRSIIITAAHCVYDDANKAFARNVLFIPDQAGTSPGAGTDRNCSNDPLGCWAPSFGVVDIDWTTSTFPDNVEWDYAYYVVSDSGAHSGTSTDTDVLDAEAGSMGVSFLAPYIVDGDASASSPDFTHALGYSYSEDPNFMYCAEDMITEGEVNWWLPSCELSGGSSGGPWTQSKAADLGVGPIMSVNSWGYTTAPGMAGPMLSGTSAECIFDKAKLNDFSSEPYNNGEAGVVVDNYTCP